MATETAAELVCRLTITDTYDPTVDPGKSGDTTAKIENATGGRRWSYAATGSSATITGAYKRIRTVGAGATDSYDLAAAGSLTDTAGRAIDADELKSLVVKVTAGEVKIDAPAANAIGIFSDPSDLILLGASAACRVIMLDFGPDGLDVTTNSKFDIVETSGVSTATYELEFIYSA